MNKVLFSKKSDNWATPRDLYARLHAKYKFDYDPCPLNADFDGLKTQWYGNVFCNPPYSDIKSFLEKGFYEIQNGNCNFIIYLLPARTDTKWFHEFIYKKCKIIFIKGRLKFEGGKHSAPFPSMLVLMEK